MRTRPGTRRRVLGLFLALSVLVLVSLASLAIGAQPISPSGVAAALLHPDNSPAAVIVDSLRVPRTALGLAVGAALGLAGALMQALTRNPLADPGLLGVNAGAAAAVVTGIGVLGLSSATQYVWLALAGAGIAATGVAALGARGPAGGSPVRLALAGAAISAVLGAYITALVLADQSTFDDYRFWSVGALVGRPVSVLGAVAPLLVGGAALAAGSARSLNALALGSPVATGIGAHPGRTQAIGLTAITLLCGAATAAAGPIGFIGLTVPHAARAITGPDWRWILPYSAVLAPILLLAADIAGRVIDPPSEIDVGIMTAFIGAPAFIWLVRRRAVRA